MFLACEVPMVLEKVLDPLIDSVKTEQLLQSISQRTADVVQSKDEPLGVQHTEIAQTTEDTCSPSTKIKPRSMQSYVQSRPINFEGVPFKYPATSTWRAQVIRINWSAGDDDIKVGFMMLICKIDQLSMPWDQCLVVLLHIVDIEVRSAGRHLYVEMQKAERQVSLRGRASGKQRRSRGAVSQSFPSFDTCFSWLASCPNFRHFKISSSRVFERHTSILHVLEPTVSVTRTASTKYSLVL